MTLELTDKDRIDLIHCVSSQIYRNETYIGNLMKEHTKESIEIIQSYRRDIERLEALKKKIIFEVKI